MRVAGLLVLLSLALGGAAQAKDPPPAARTVGEKMRLECGDSMFYPYTERDSGDEGWVDLRMTVKANGDLTDLEVINSFGDDVFPKAAMSIISKCHVVNPRQVNGVAVDVMNVPLRYFFRIRQQSTGASRTIYRQLKDVQSLTEQGKLDEAEALQDKLEANVGNLYEITHAMIRRAALMAKRNKPDVALLYIRELSGSADFIEPEEYAQLLRLRLGLELVLGLVADAETTAADLAARNVSLDGDPMKAGLEQLRALAASGQALGVAGRVPSECRPVICRMGSPSWGYTPVHRTLSLADVKGTLRTVTFRCDRRVFEAAAEPDVTWTIPASWGKCLVSVEGEPGTTFSLIDEDVPS